MIPAFSRHRLRPIMLPAILLALGIAAGALPLTAQATATPFPSALSSRIVRFIANPNYTYVLYLHPGMVTDIQLAQGERLKVLAVGDTARWITQQVPGTNDVFIKPVKAGIETSATLVTNRHTYQMMLVSRKKGDWYQEVHFEVSSPIVFAAPHASAATAVSTAPPRQPVYTTHGVAGQIPANNRNRLWNLKLSELRFGWTIHGTASFRPIRVFSSPDFVWIELPAHALAPVVFSRQGNTWGLVNYTPKGRWIVVQGHSKALELRADGQRVRLYAPGARS